jgi:hypothetical protein
MSWLEFATLASMTAALFALWASGRWFDRQCSSLENDP